MKRIPGWEKRLIDTIQRHRAIPFDWETANCGTLILDVVEAVTGERERFARHLTSVTGPVSAKRKLKIDGFESIGDLLASYLEEVPPAFARRGDLCIVEIDGEDHGAVMSDEHVVGKSATGVIMIPRGKMKRAFRL